MVRLSHPACAITSAEKELGTCNHPFTAVSPSRQIFLRRFSLILDPSRRDSVSRRTDPSRIPAEVAAGRARGLEIDLLPPALPDVADPQVAGRRVEREPPRVPQAVVPYLRARARLT